MRKTAILLTLVALLLTGCRHRNAFDPQKYEGYICYDRHLACLDAYEKYAIANTEYGNTFYTLTFRKPVGVSDEQFICVKFQVPFMLNFPDLAIMQNPDDYIDVFRDWTVKQIDINVFSLHYPTPIWEEEEPARTPKIVLSTSTDKAVIDEFVEFVTNSDYYERPNYSQMKEEKYNEDDTYYLGIRVHFNESENIVWDTDLRTHIMNESGLRNIIIDKGRETQLDPPSFTTYSCFTSISGLSNLEQWISESVDSIACGTESE